jgi:hypothetical protein
VQSEGLEWALRFLSLSAVSGQQRAYALITAGRLAITVQDHPLATRLLTDAKRLREERAR